VGTSGVIKAWKTIGEEEVADCRIFQLRRVRRRHPDLSLEGAFYYMATTDWVNVVAVTDSAHLVLVRQYRHGTDEVTLEIPGGLLDEGETPIEGARRELIEETGFVPGRLRVIGRVRSNPAIVDNWTWTVLATELTATDGIAPDEHEDIAVELHRVADIDELLRTGAITHALVIDAFMWYRLEMGAAHDSPA